MLEPRQQQRLVAPDRFDQLGAGTVGARGDRANQRRRIERDAAVGERADDQEALARLEIEGHADGQLAVTVEFHS